MDAVTEAFDINSRVGPCAAPVALGHWSRSRQVRCGRCPRADSASSHGVPAAGPVGCGWPSKGPGAAGRVPAEIPEGPRRGGLPGTTTTGRLGSGRVGGGTKIRGRGRRCPGWALTPTRPAGEGHSLRGCGNRSKSDRNQGLSLPEGRGGGDPAQLQRPSRETGWAPVAPPGRWEGRVNTAQAQGTGSRGSAVLRGAGPSSVGPEQGHSRRRKHEGWEDARRSWAAMPAVISKGFWGGRDTEEPRLVSGLAGDTRQTRFLASGNV